MFLKTLALQRSGLLLILLLLLQNQAYKGMYTSQAKVRLRFNTVSSLAKFELRNDMEIKKKNGFVVIVKMF